MITETAAEAGKAHENRVRRAAARQGFALRKSRTPDVLALDYGWHILRGDEELAHLRDLAQVEEWLRNPASRGKGDDHGTQDH